MPGTKATNPTETIVNIANMVIVCIDDRASCSDPDKLLIGMLYVSILSDDSPVGLQFIYIWSGSGNDIFVAEALYRKPRTAQTTRLRHPHNS